MKFNNSIKNLDCKKKIILIPFKLINIFFTDDHVC